MRHNSTLQPLRNRFYRRNPAMSQSNDPKSSGKRLNERLTELYVKHNTAGKTYDEFFNTMKFDTFLSAAEAVEFGLADRVVESRQ